MTVLTIQVLQLEERDDGGGKKQDDFQIANLELPAAGVPAAGDVVQLMRGPTREWYRVVLREYTWTGAAGQATTVLPFLSVTLFVRPLTAEDRDALMMRTTMTFHRP